MNEIIKELAKQADAGYIPRYDMWQMDSETVQKFAELIVRECIDILPEKVKIDDLYEGRILVQCGMAIKEHFGVE